MARQLKFEFEGDLLEFESRTRTQTRIRERNLELKLELKLLRDVRRALELQA